MTPAIILIRYYQARLREFCRRRNRSPDLPNPPRWLRIYGAQTAQELADELIRISDEDFTLKEAAIVTGYSTGHLGRMIRRGKIPNAGRKTAPRIKGRHLPRKPLQTL